MVTALITCGYDLFHDFTKAAGAFVTLQAAQESEVTSDQL